MYSCGEKSEILQEVLRTNLTFQDGEFTNLHFHIKLLLDNFQVTFTLRQKPLFQKTLKVKVFYLDVYNVISKINQLDRDISIISLVLFGLIIGKNMILYVWEGFLSRPPINRYYPLWLMPHGFVQSHIGKRRLPHMPYNLSPRYMCTTTTWNPANWGPRRETLPQYVMDEFKLY